jgi:hypothetical protein
MRLQYVCMYIGNVIMVIFHFNCIILLYIFYSVVPAEYPSTHLRKSERYPSTHL